MEIYELLFQRISRDYVEKSVIISYINIDDPQVKEDARVVDIRKHAAFFPVVTVNNAIVAEGTVDFGKIIQHIDMAGALKKS
ncbi:hypothetical protein BHU72_09195 [Desulfuribacillus stibiiarsenatis]|uniref:Thioredoxin-like fold domain-containing protein n=1 Tax=Desulfuribacillus stibiiarsenatis TaxID=1390249 RepID=A0A1E5L3H7_9FIRM|nr:DUF1462 family protein [Desulfuribacillus stibiiarsenatis]OEH84657.1 hypothetical protein BHU72_09195 [Desulfuribacillus stibiiarsenatis]